MLLFDDQEHRRKEAINALNIEADKATESYNQGEADGDRAKPPTQPECYSYWQGYCRLLILVAKTAKSYP